MCTSVTWSDQEKEVLKQFMVVGVTHCISVLLNILNNIGPHRSWCWGRRCCRQKQCTGLIGLVCSFLQPTQNLQIRIHRWNTLTSRFPNSALQKQYIKFTVFVKHITIACRMLRNPPLLKYIPNEFFHLLGNRCFCFVVCTDKMPHI